MQMRSTYAMTPTASALSDEFIAMDSIEAVDIFRHLDAKEVLLEREVSIFIGANKGTHTFPRTEVEGLLQLKQLPTLFRASFSDLIQMLPVTISVGTGIEDPTATLTTADMPKSHYARYRCIFSTSEGKQCCTWTRIPYVIDTYLQGLASVLAVAANSSISKDRLETQLQTGLKMMVCQQHDEEDIAIHTGSLAVACRMVIEEWRNSEHLWRSEGKLASRERSAEVHSSVEPLMAQNVTQEVIRLHAENGKLRGELLALREVSRLPYNGGTFLNALQ